MILIKHENGDESRWFINDVFFYWMNIQSVVEVQADGNELEYINKNFDNIPFHNSKETQRWFGDMARFIAGNLGG